MNLSDVPVLAWALPVYAEDHLNPEFGTAFVGRQCEEVAFTMSVHRSKQLTAIARRESQPADHLVLWRRPELQGDLEWLRYLCRPAGGGTWPR